MPLDCEILAFIEQHVSITVGGTSKPQYAWGRAGSNNPLQYLDNNGVPSNRSGIPFGKNNGQLIELWISNPNLADFDISLYHHEGNEFNLTLVTTKNIAATDRVKIYTVADLGQSIPNGVQMAARIAAVNSGNAKDTEVFAQIIGTT